MPQLSVSPTPRSKTRMRIEPTPSRTSGSLGTTNSMFAPRGGSGCSCGTRGQVEPVELVGVGQRDDDVRIADVDPEPGPRHAETAGAHEHIVGLDPPRAEVGLEPEVAAGDAS